VKGKATAPGNAAGMSDAAVRARTGKGWAEWFAVLDAARATDTTHKEMARLLYERHQCTGWWSQMIAVGYERERGLRVKHERPDGFQISVSRTLAVPVRRAYQAWQDPERRVRWLEADGLVVRKATANKSIRATWADGKTNLEVAFYPKDAGKCQVAVQHGRLADAKAAARMKSYGAAALGRLKEFLE
jgi:uncharacterized protein YndB with AHSA1/START domain